EKEDGIATLTLNRPQRLNAVNDQVFADLEACLADIAQDPGLRVVVITGAGRAFCSGADFKGDQAAFQWLDKGDLAGFQAYYHSFIANLVRGVQNLHLPIIAMVNGPALGIGFDFVLLCDIRVGSDKAEFSVLWVRRGVIPAAGGALLLPRIVGVDRAADLMFTARFVGAEEAYRIGILDRLVPHDDLRRETMALARSIAENPPVAVRLTKLCLYRGLDADFSTGLELLGACQTIAIHSEDFKEAASAFREKREPRFQGR
ncbi:MAG: enoyl-CoA hydratase/isomerase family protein, partial [Dehalococcoidia bacterium]